MQLDIINFATKLLSKCVPVKVQYLKMEIMCHKMKLI